MQINEWDIVFRVSQNIGLMQQKQNSDEILIPPANFALVAKGIYRGSYPNFKNFSFLKNLGLKSLIKDLLDDLDSDDFRKDISVSIIRALG